MQVQIALETPHTTWTNLDFIRGKVILRLPSSTPISSIVVKLEGESRTRLKALPKANSATSASGAQGVNVGGGRVEDDWSGEKPVIREELHKILYKVSSVFPDVSLENLPAQQRHYTLPPGEHQYPFVFKASLHLELTPYILNDTQLPNVLVELSPGTSNSLAQLAGLKKGATLSATHVKKTLPPTLTAFPGLAEVRYYLKVTVKRKEFYKENPRTVSFFSIENLSHHRFSLSHTISKVCREPPRPPKTNAETYARRQHRFVDPEGPVSRHKKTLLNAFRKNASGDEKLNVQKSVPPVVSVDARLPSPAILTCNDSIPLRIIVRRLNNNADQIYLQSLHIQLSGNTRIKAGEIVRDEPSNWIIFSKSNIGVPLLSMTGEVGGEGEDLIVDSRAWLNKPLPNTVAPTFETCNIVRKYELEIHVGISYGNTRTKNASIVPLHHPVQVYSGITPPPALLAAMANSRTIPSRKPIPANGSKRPYGKSAALAASSHLQEVASSSYSNDSAIPSTFSMASSHPAKAITGQQQQFGPQLPDEEEPPPSYEDAIAEDLPPLDGPRRNYNPPPLTEGNRGFTFEKGRRDS